MVPQLHVVTDDDVLARPSFSETAAALVRSHGPRIALHLRGHATAAGRLYELAAALGSAARDTGAGLLIADRLDVALATPGAGVRLGTRSIPAAVARRLLGERPLACSVHSAAGAVDAARDGANFLVVGTIWPTASHPGRKGAGLALVAAVAARVEIPVVVIGGVTPERAAEAIGAGAAGVAVLGGIWNASDPLSAAARYLEGG